MRNIEFYTVKASSPRPSSTVGTVIIPNIRSGYEVVYPAFWSRTNAVYYYGAQNTNGGSPSLFIGGYAGSPTSYYQTDDYNSIVFAVPSGESVDTVLSNNSSMHKFTKKVLAGRYKFKSAFTTFKLPNYTNKTYYSSKTAIIVPCYCEYNGEIYEYFGGVATTNDKTTNYDTFYLIKSDQTYITLKSANMVDTTIYFGDYGNEIPDFVYDWVIENTNAVYPYTYTVKNYLGDVVLSSIVEAPPMKEVTLIDIEDLKVLTLKGINDVEYELRWNTTTPEGKQFIGLSNSPESSRVALPSNTTLSISWEGDLVLYEAYGKYRPPTTVFDINLYKNSAEVNRVDKGMFLEGVGTLSGALRDECSLITPSIVYQSSDVPVFNYVYIPIFNRYYYVTSLSSVGKNVWRMELNCDVLMTYKDAIFMLQGVVGRQENEFNPLLVDTEIPAQSNPIVQVIDIPSDAFNTQTSDEGHNFLMTVIGS